MSIFAAVMTGRGTGAISTVQVFGERAEGILEKIFRPAGAFKPGTIRLGTIRDGTETIDEVTVGCEADGCFAINCHGNPLIVADIMQLLGRHGAVLLTAEELLTKMLSAQKHLDTIAIEAKLAQAKARTIEGAGIIVNQIDAGLSREAKKWLTDINTISLDEITTSAGQILQTSRTAKLIIAGCTAVLAGPANTGKSTLLNCLAGREKAIVSSIRGTTRDWVTAKCQIDSVSMELIDTAGLDGKLTAAAENTIEKISQEKSIGLLEGADLILLVLDSSRTVGQLEARDLEKIAGKRILTVLNKSDLPAVLDAGELPEILDQTVLISAKFGSGIEGLLKKIRQVCGVDEFDFKTAVCFTDRQHELLKQLQKAKSKDQAVSIITELLNGRLCV